MNSWSQIFDLLDCIAVYFALQLMRCVIFSCVLIVLVMLLRQTLFSKLIFAKAMLWAPFLLIPFMGKMKLFYENTVVLKATWWLTGSVMTYVWTAHIYMAGVLLSFLYIFGKRVHLKRIVSRMERRTVNDKPVYMTEMKVTPFAVGLLRPKIVLPEVLVNSYSRQEIEEIIRHEQTHIRLGHLWCYLAWDILRCLLWLNPLLSYCQRYFQADVEDMCDRVCIQNSEWTAQEYGLLLIRTLKLLRSEQESVSSAAAYAGGKNYQDTKRRVVQIAAFRSYRKALCRSMAVASAALLCIAFMGINSISYARCNELDNILVYEYDLQNEKAVILDSSDCLKQMISYDDDCVYVDRAAFEAFLGENHAQQEVYIVFGGYQKLPGIGGGANSCYYQTDTNVNIVEIPYERGKDNWVTELFKIL